MLESSAPKLTFILLLGSYDLDTKTLLDLLKRKIAEKYGGEGVFAFLLDELEIYSTKEYFALVERWTEERISVHTFHRDGTLKESYDLEITKEKIIDEAIKGLLRKELDVKEVTKLPVLEKLELIMKISKEILVIRDREETRGGEIAELIYCIMSGLSEKVCFFKKEGFMLSSMLMEFLDKQRVVIRTYRNHNDLVDSVLRFLSYRLSQNQT